MIGCSSSIPQNSTVNAAPATERRSRGSARRVPGRRRTAARSRRRVGTTQPKQAPNPHAIPDSSASCAGVARSAHSRRTASSIAGGRRRTPRLRGSASQLVGEQLGDEAVVADAAVVGGDPRRRLSSAAPCARARRPGSRAARCGTGAQLDPARIASGAIPTPPPTSSGAAVRRGVGRTPSPSGPTSSSSIAGARARTGAWCPGRRPRSGTRARRSAPGPAGR